MELPQVWRLLKDLLTGVSIIKLTDVEQMVCPRNSGDWSMSNFVNRTHPRMNK